MKSNFATSTYIQNQWLQSYYYIRAAGSIIWIALALFIGKHNPTVGTILLVLYPTWDAFANYLDARQSGGLALNPPQKFNFIVSLVVAAAIIWALSISMNTTIKVFGIWAIFFWCIAAFCFHPSLEKFKWTMGYGLEWSAICIGGCVYV